MEEFTEEDDVIIFDVLDKEDTLHNFAVQVQDFFLRDDYNTTLETFRGNMCKFLYDVVMEMLIRASEKNCRVSQII